MEPPYGSTQPFQIHCGYEYGHHHSKPRMSSGPHRWTEQEDVEMSVGKILLAWRDSARIWSKREEKASKQSKESERASNDTAATATKTTNRKLAPGKLPSAPLESKASSASRHL